MATIQEKLHVLLDKLKETDHNLSVCVTLLQQYLRKEMELQHQRVVVLALATVAFAEEQAPAKEKRGILGGLGYGSYSLGHGGLALGGLGLGHGVSLASAPIVSHASYAAPLSLGHGLGYGLGGLSLGGYSAAPLLSAPVVSKAIAAPIYTKTIAPIAPIAPVLSAPIVTKAIATPLIAKTIAAPAISYGSYGHGLSLGYSGLGLGYH